MHFSVENAYETFPNIDSPKSPYIRHNIDFEHGRGHVFLDRYYDEYKAFEDDKMRKEAAYERDVEPYREILEAANKACRHFECDCEKDKNIAHARREFTKREIPYLEFKSRNWHVFHTHWLDKYEEITPEDVKSYFEYIEADGTEKIKSAAKIC
jgi:hypothetical protein